MQDAQLLKKSALFSNLNKETVRYFVENSGFKIYERGAELFVKGEPADAIFFIIEGWVKLYRITQEGEEAIINVFTSGETFAEAAVFGLCQSYPVNAQAVEKTKILKIPRTLFVNKIKENSDFALHILGSISLRQRYLIQHIEQITIKNAPQRLGTFLLRLCPPDKDRSIKIDLPYDKLLIAHRLNIQPETFSRALAKLKPYGVNIDGRRIIVENTEKLAEFCGVEYRDELY